MPFPDPMDIITAEPTPYEIFPLTRHEAQEHTDAVKYHINEAGRHLLIMREAEGWRALDYQSFTQYLEREFVQCRSHLYDLMRASPVVERLQRAGYQVATSHALELAKLPEIVQIPAYEIASKRPGGVTADRLKAVGEVLTEAVQSGHVTTEDGNQVAFEAAYKALRREQEITHTQAQSTDAVVTKHYIQDDGDYVVLRLSAAFPVKLGQTVKVRLAL